VFVCVAVFFCFVADFLVYLRSEEPSSNSRLSASTWNIEWISSVFVACVCVCVFGLYVCLCVRRFVCVGIRASVRVCVCVWGGGGGAIAHGTSKKTHEA